MSNPGLVRKIADSPAGSPGEVSYSQIVNQTEKSRNFIINGNFDVWQRGTSQTWTTNGYYYERWFSGHTGSNTITRQSATGLDGSTYCLRVTYAGGTSNINDFYYMEDRDVDALKGKTVTWSMYVRRSGSLNNGWALRVGKNATANTRTGGSWSQILSTTFQDSEIAVTGDWSLISVTFQVPNDGTANGLRLNMVNLNNVTTAGAYIEIAQMALNIGEERAPFMLYGGNISGELAACQRYYNRYSNTVNANAQWDGVVVGNGYALSSTDTRVVFDFPQPMRASPTLSVSDVGHFNCIHEGVSVQVTNNVFMSIVSSDETKVRAQVLFIVGVAMGGLLGKARLVHFVNAANAWLAFDAEF